MDKIIKLRKEMNDWLFREDLSIAECFRVANDLKEWKVKLFYATFAPYMANLLDDILAPKSDNDPFEGIPIGQTKGNKK